MHGTFNLFIYYQGTLRVFVLLNILFTCIVIFSCATVASPSSTKVQQKFKEHYMTCVHVHKHDMYIVLSASASNLLFSCVFQHNEAAPSSTQKKEMRLNTARDTFVISV